MFGWRRTVAASASRRKRIGEIGVGDDLGAEQLDRDGRSRRVSVARWMVAIPPRPMTGPSR